MITLGEVAAKWQRLADDEDYRRRNEMTEKIEAQVQIHAPLQGPEHILQFFAYDHLPLHLQMISAPFHVLAHLLVEGTGTTPAVPRNPERTVALRKLLEAKDAAVRARLAK